MAKHFSSSVVGRKQSRCPGNDHIPNEMKWENLNFELKSLSMVLSQRNSISPEDPFGE